MKEMLSNKILNSMPDAEFALLMPFLEPASLSHGKRVVVAGEEARFVYFPESAVVSCRAEMQDGKTAEVGLIGKEGVAGFPAPAGSRPSPHTLTVAVAGTALRMQRQEFEHEMRRSEGFRASLLNYASDYVTQVSQRSACNALHLMEQRMAVWLLLLTDRLAGDSIEITQERMAHHLGVRRAGVSVIAAELQERGVISYTRGNLRVVDRRALERVACECYTALSAQGRGRIAA